MFIFFENIAQSRIDFPGILLLFEIRVRIFVKPKLLYVPFSGTNIGINSYILRSLVVFKIYNNVSRISITEIDSDYKNYNDK